MGQVQSDEERLASLRASHQVAIENELYWRQRVEDEIARQRTLCPDCRKPHPPRPT